MDRTGKPAVKKQPPPRPPPPQAGFAKTNHPSSPIRHSPSSNRTPRPEIVRSSPTVPSRKISTDKNALNRSPAASRNHHSFPYKVDQAARGDGGSGSTPKLVRQPTRPPLFDKPPGHSSCPPIRKTSLQQQYQVYPDTTEIQARSTEVSKDQTHTSTASPTTRRFLNKVNKIATTLTSSLHKQPQSVQLPPATNSAPTSPIFTTSDRRHNWPPAPQGSSTSNSGGPLTVGIRSVRSTEALHKLSTHEVELKTKCIPATYRNRTLPAIDLAEPIYADLNDTNHGNRTTMNQDPTPYAIFNQDDDEYMDMSSQTRGSSAVTHGDNSDDGEDGEYVEVSQVAPKTTYRSPFAQRKNHQTLPMQAVRSKKDPTPNEEELGPYVSFSPLHSSYK